MVRQYSIELGDKQITVEHGRMAKQADGAVLVSCGGSMVLVTACMSPTAPDLPFFPLTIEYRERGYAAGKIPGSIFKREGRPSDEETLSARLIDHQIRPLFPKKFRNEVQIIVTVLSHDQENDPDILACLGASIAVNISKIPFMGPYGTVRVARNGEGGKVLNPTYAEREESDCDIVVAGGKSSVSGIEGEAREINEEVMLDLMLYGHEAIRKLVEFQEGIVAEIGVPKVEVPVDEPDEALVARVEDLAAARIRESLAIAEKVARNEAQDEIVAEVVAALAEDYPTEQRTIITLINQIEKREMRKRILDEGVRIDGRKVDDVRNITCEVSILPRAHGSSLFTRGQTQALGAVTLGTRMDERLVDNLEGKSYKNYMLDYNFPPFSTGEVKRVGAPGRREIGHGHLAERAIEPVIPASDSFPYTLRIVSDVLESNGSSSMASVCAASLALMDAGVPIKTPVAGVNIGLVTDGTRTAILTDLLGVEDANGDMDLKIAGTAQGITAFQMDIKVAGISIDVLREAFERARQGRLYVLEVMNAAISAPREQLSRFAPRILTMQVQPSQIGSIIGPGGKIIREIQEQTGTTIEIEDDGTVTIASLDGEGGERALQIIRNITREPQIGEIFEGPVKSILPFGALIELYPGRDGLLHISEISPKRIEKVEDEINIGDVVKVIILGVEQGKVKLSRKRLMPGYEPKEGDNDGGSRGGGRDRDRRPRGGGEHRR